MSTSCMVGAVGIEPTTFGSKGPTKAIGLRLTVEPTQ